MRKFLIASGLIVAASLSACSAPATPREASAAAPVVTASATAAPTAAVKAPAKPEAPKVQPVKPEAPKAVQQAPKAVQQADKHMAAAPKEFKQAAQAYVPCSAVGMVADAKGVCHAPKAPKAVKSKAPVQSVKAPVQSGTKTNYVPGVDPKTDPTGTATNVQALCYPLPLGSGGAVTGATIEQLWKAATLGSTKTPAYQLCGQADPSLSPAFNDMTMASAYAGNGVWVLFDMTKA